MPLLSMLARVAALDPDHVALRLSETGHGADRELTAGGLLARANAAGMVLAAHGIGAGDRVGWLGGNAPELIELLFALAGRGAILVPLNFRLAAPELSAVADDAGLALCVVDAEHEALARRAFACAVEPLDAWRAAVEAGVAADPRAVAATCGGARSDDGAAATPCLIVYTSGTTGAPKGAVHTQAGLLANADAAIAVQGLGPDDHVLTMLPLFHVGGLCIQTLPALLAGATVTLHARFDPGRWIDDVARLRPTLSLLVPPVMQAIVAHPGWPAADLGSLRLLMAGSSVVPEHLIEAFHARGVPCGQVYGATETGPVSVVLGGDDARARIGSVGWPAHGVELRLRAVEAVAPCMPTVASPAAGPAPGALPARGGAPLLASARAGAGPLDPDRLPAGTVGEILLRAPNLMAGYWRGPGRAPDPGTDADGWFATGDLGRVDADGCLACVGRTKDMIISGGENVYPAEVEALIARLPGVAAVAVVGLPDPRWGEVPVAAIVRAPGAALAEADVLAALRERIARYKQPRRVAFVDALPLTALGKVAKPALQALLAHDLPAVGPVVQSTPAAA